MLKAYKYRILVQNKVNSNSCLVKNIVKMVQHDKIELTKETPIFII